MDKDNNLLSSKHSRYILYLF